MGEDGLQVRIGVAPRVMSALRNLVLSIFRIRGATNIAATMRNVGWQPNGALRILVTLPRY